MNELKKYYKPVPRYTSYPTVPYWDDLGFSIEGYEQRLIETFKSSNGEVSLYLHLPFCESLCTYCACNTRITKNHAVEEPYVNHLLAEWTLYKLILPDVPVIREVHLGGGTPTFFSPENLYRLMDGILADSIKSPDLEMSFEGHPGNTTIEHLQTLRKAGFTRVSFGIQDFDETVQQHIHRFQSFEQVKFVTEAARTLGYSSVNYDIVYGLPGQQLCTLNATIDKLLELKPDRIAFYSYAHVPTMRPAQKSFEAFLPTADLKWQLLHLGRAKFQKAGYRDVGMDHFVLATDSLLKAQNEGRLHRNFMGYTTYTSKVLIGLGVSSISDTWTGFAQNEKIVETYSARIDAGKLPIVKGHLLTPEDAFFRAQILSLMCTFETHWTDQENEHYMAKVNHELLTQLAQDGLIEWGDCFIKIRPLGREFIRVVGSALDARMLRSRQIVGFSQAI